MHSCVCCLLFWIHFEEQEIDNWFRRSMSTKRHAPICNWDNFFSLSSSLASRDSRSKMLINLNFLLKYKMFCAWTLLWKKSENMVFHLRRSSSPLFVCLAVVFERIFQRSSIVECLCKLILVKQKMSQV